MTLPPPCLDATDALPKKLTATPLPSCPLCAVVAGLNVQLVAMLTCTEPRNGARILATAYVPLHDKPVQAS